MNSLVHKLLLGALVLSVAFSSCLQEKKKEIHFVQLPHAEWTREDTLRFDIFVPQSQSSLFAEIQLRLNNDFEWLELPLGYTLHNTLGFTKEGKTSIRIAQNPGDFKNFKGSYRQFEVALEPFYSLPTAGLYEIKLYLQCEKPLLRGVENVGIATSID